jgi:hypothetical protein
MANEPEHEEEVVFTKRYSDHVKNRSDRDLLIGHSKDIKLICKKLDDREKKREDFETRIYDKIGEWSDKVDLRCESRLSMIGTKMGASTFRWLFGLLVLAVLSMAGAVSYNRVDISQAKSLINSNAVHIQENIKTIQGLCEP